MDNPAVASSRSERFAVCESERTRSVECASADPCAEDASSVKERRQCCAIVLLRS